MYRIQNTRTGLFSLGGVLTPQWSKRGKTWSGLGPLKQHLNQYIRDGRVDVYQDAVIVEYEVVVTEVRRVSVSDICAEVATKRAAKKAEIAARWQAEHEKRERAELQRLQAKYKE